MPRKGYKWTSEHRANYRIARTGKKRPPRSQQWCDNLSNSLTGKKKPPLTPERRANLSTIQKILWKNPEIRDKHIASQKIAQNRPEVKAAHSGSNASNWRGGISREPYGWDFNNELREEVRRRDGYKCQLCDIPQIECKRKLTIHHVDYDKKNSDPVNLITLCCGCNTRVNFNRDYWTKYFQDKIKNRATAC